MCRVTLYDERSGLAVKAHFLNVDVVACGTTVDCAPIHIGAFIQTLCTECIIVVGYASDKSDRFSPTVFSIKIMGWRLNPIIQIPGVQLTPAFDIDWNIWLIPSFRSMGFRQLIPSMLTTGFRRNHEPVKTSRRRELAPLTVATFLLPER